MLRRYTVTTMKCITIWLIVVLALGLLAAPLPAEAQQPTKVWRIGLFHVGLDHVPSSLDGLREGLKALGYEEGKTIHLDWRNLADEAAAHETAKAFVRDGVDLIVADDRFKGKTLRTGGRLADIAPTLLAMGGIAQPVGMTGSSLLNG